MVLMKWGLKLTKEHTCLFVTLWCESKVRQECEGSERKSYCRSARWSTWAWNRCGITLVILSELKSQSCSKFTPPKINKHMIWLSFWFLINWNILKNVWKRYILYRCAAVGADHYLIHLLHICIYQSKRDKQHYHSCKFVRWIFHN